MMAFVMPGMPVGGTPNAVLITALAGLGSEAGFPFTAAILAWNV